MDKAEAVKVLARDFAERNLINIIREETIKEKLLKESEYVMLNWTGYNYLTPFLGDSIKYLAEERETSEIGKRVISLGANYLFLSSAINFCYDKLAITPLALIGKEELKSLRKHYQEKMPSHIIIAGDALDGSFSDILSAYGQYSKGEEIDFYHSIRAEAMVPLYDFLLNDLDSKKRNAEGDAMLVYSVDEWYVSQKAAEILPLVKEFLLREYKEGLNDSFKAAFEKLSCHLNRMHDSGYAISVPLRENYSLFCRELGLLEKRSLELDLWLHKNFNFEINNTPMVEIYKKDTQLFAEKFKGLNETEKIEFISLILSLDSENSNKEANKWISETFPDLVTTAGREKVSREAKDDNVGKL